MFRRFSIFSSSSLGFCLSRAWISGVGAGLNVMWYLERRRNATFSAQPEDTAATSADIPCFYLSQPLGLFLLQVRVLEQNFRAGNLSLLPSRTLDPQRPRVFLEGTLVVFICSTQGEISITLPSAPGSEAFPDLLLVIFDSCIFKSI